MIKIGHRGACGYEPENTLRSFDRAMQLGVDMVELDVHICKSGEIVVIHDENVDRTTSGTGLVVDKTLDELKTLDAGEGERIPTLEEVLDLISRRVKMGIELKGNGMAKPVVGLIKKYINESGWFYGDFLVFSFNRDELREIRKLDNKLNIGASKGRFSDEFLEFTESIGASSILVNFDFITVEIINQVRARGLKTIVWTVDDKEDIERMKSLGVDGIVSNYPDRI